jgi:hypothetical protein
MQKTQLEKLRELKPYINIKSVAAGIGMKYETLYDRISGKRKVELNEKQAMAVSEYLGKIVNIINS